MKIVDLTSNKELVFDSLRQVALYLSSTGQTVKTYANTDKIFKTKYKIYME